MSLCDTAIDYAARFGWSVHPVNTAKKPITPHGRNDATRDEPAIRKMFKNGSQIGVATGPESNLFVLDIDLDQDKGVNGYETLEYLESVHGPLPRTPQQRTGRGGMQYLFAHFDGAKNSSSKIGAGVDTRGAGGYIVAAPSRNQAGPYEWLVSPDDCPLAECPMWIRDALREAETPQPAQSSANGNERSYCKKMLGQAVARVATAADGQKHEMLLKMARWLGGFVPVLTESEIESALFAAIELRADDHRNARKTIRDGIAYGMQQPLDPPKQREPTRSSEIVDPRPKPDYVEATWKPDIIAASSLWHKDFPALVWLVDGVIPEGAVILAGKPKSKKSWCALAIAVATAYGGKAFGYYDVTQGRVLYLDLESNQRRMKSRLRGVIGDRVAWPDNFDIATEWKRGDEGIAYLDGYCEAHPDTRLIVIDIWAKFRAPRDPKGDMYEQDYNELQKLNAWAESRRVTVLVIHHTRKMKAVDVFEEISGSYGIIGAVATAMVLSKSPDMPDEQVLHRVGRDLIEDDPIAMKWDSYTCQHIYVATGKEASSSAERRALLNLMEDDQEYQLKELAALSKKTVQATTNLLARLQEDELIQRTGRGKYARVPKVSVDDVSSVESVNGVIGVKSETKTLHDLHLTDRLNVNGSVNFQTLSEPSNPLLHSLHDDSHIHEKSSVFSDLSTADAFKLRNYLRLTEYQDRARALCEKHGIDYDQAKREVSE